MACWAHARRKFYQSREGAPAQADFVLELIGVRYADVRRRDEMGLNEPGEREDLRQTEWTPWLNWLRRAALGLCQDVQRSSRLGLACQYLLNQWDALAAPKNTVAPASTTTAWKTRSARRSSA